MSVSILRLSHRLARDERISTHCGLVSRALGASEIIYAGEKDDGVLESINKITSKWGGLFSVSYEESWRSVVRKYKKKNYCIVHLTMYGIPVQTAAKKIRKEKNVLVIIGSEKVPPDVYEETDFNVAVTNQPHSEVAALAVFLHEYFQGKELGKKFKGAKISIKPDARGKTVIEK